MLGLGDFCQPSKLGWQKFTPDPTSNLLWIVGTQQLSIGTCFHAHTTYLCGHRWTHTLTLCLTIMNAYTYVDLGELTPSPYVWLPWSVWITQFVTCTMYNQIQLTSKNTWLKQEKNLIFLNNHTYRFSLFDCFLLLFWTDWSRKQKVKYFQRMFFKNIIIDLYL